MISRSPLGSVDTPLSEPYQLNVKPGKLLTKHQAARQLSDVIDALTPADSGASLPGMARQSDSRHDLVDTRF